MIHGHEDDKVQIDFGRFTFQALTGAGVKGDFVTYHYFGHDFDNDGARRHLFDFIVQTRLNTTSAV